MKIWKDLEELEKNLKVLSKICIIFYMLYYLYVFKFYVQYYIYMYMYLDFLNI